MCYMSYPQHDSALSLVSVRIHPASIENTLTVVPARHAYPPFFICFHHHRTASRTVRFKRHDSSRHVDHIFPTSPDHEHCHCLRDFTPSRETSTTGPHPHPRL
jgi:hypothetical protein